MSFGRLGLRRVALLVAAIPLQGQMGQEASPSDAHAAPCILDEISWSDPERVSLPRGLREISGLAVLDSTRLLAHDDERGLIAIIDAERGQRVGEFALGPALPRDDFEGIAVLDDRLYLATSQGRIYEAPIGVDGQIVPYRVLDTGLGPACELEGLTSDAVTRSLLLSCKLGLNRDFRGDVLVFEWSVDQAILRGTRVRVRAATRAAEGRRSFRPSAVDLLPSRDLLLLSGADRALTVITPPGKEGCTQRLDSDHRQPEGLAVLPDGSLVIADEGRGDRALLTIYRPQ